MSEQEKGTIEDCKELVQELKQHKDKDFIGRLYYKNKPIEDILSVLLNLIENQQKELNNLKEIEQSHQEENGKLRVEFEKVYEDNLTLAQELEQEKEKNKELERYKKYYENEKVVWNRNDYISKDKIKERIERLENKIHIVVPNEYNRMQQIDEFKNEGALDMLKDLLEEK